MGFGALAVEGAAVTGGRSWPLELPLNSMHFGGDEGLLHPSVCFTLGEWFLASAEVVHLQVVETCGLRSGIKLKAPQITSPAPGSCR